ncbi:MAG: hypothetical protein ACRECX_00960 [Methyloceanibacter sp.]|uniref:hypothetical protein n=1 Tax=Methyloceanibacter sp. TaxID=1965321 RepID=UPI003D6D0121
MAHKIRLFDRHWHLPKSKPLRIGLGILLVAFGLLGFLPVLGFWMIPLGLLVLSVDLPIVRRWRRQLTVWWHRKRGDDQAPAETGSAEKAAETRRATSEMTRLQK